MNGSKKRLICPMRTQRYLLCLTLSHNCLMSMSIYRNELVPFLVLTHSTTLRGGGMRDIRGKLGN